VLPDGGDVSEIQWVKSSRCSAGGQCVEVANIEAPQDDVVLVKVIQTGMACPSQWDAWDADGRYYYLRFRHGCGTVESAPTQELWRDECVEMPVSEEWPYGGWSWPGTDFLSRFDFETGEGLDGVISLEEFCERSGVKLADSVDRTAYWRNMANELTGALWDDPAALARADQFLGGMNLDQE
jgi:Domain of unknown function (DUF397)